MITLENARNKFVEDLCNVIEVECELLSAAEQTIDSFFNFLQSKNIFYVDFVSTKDLTEYRMKLLGMENGDEEKCLVESVSAFLVLAAKEEWIDKSVYFHWEIISSRAYFSMQFSIVN